MTKGMVKCMAKMGASRRHASYLSMIFRIFNDIKRAQWRRGGDSNPRDRSPSLPHFECGAIDHSATSPGRARSLDARAWAGPVNRRSDAGSGLLSDAALRSKADVLQGAAASRDGRKRRAVDGRRMKPQASPVRLAPHVSNQDQVHAHARRSCRDRHRICP